MTIHLTTFFDINYLSRGLTLINSIKENYKYFTLHLLCLDQETFDFFNNNIDYPEIKVIKLTEIENFFPELLECKKDRSKIEYFFTLSPFLPLYILKKYHLPHICSLDADMKFYSSPLSLFKYLEYYSIIITPHKFSKENTDLNIYGKYNVSFQIFKNDNTGVECLNDWKDQCIEWCKDEIDDQGRFADQKYLDDWEEKFPNKVLSLYNENGGIAVWNLNNYDIRYINGKFMANNTELIFYHFHHFKILNKHLAINGFFDYKVKPSIGIIKLYKDYRKSLKKWKIVKEKINVRNNLYSASNYEIIHREKSIFILYLARIFNINDVTKAKPFLKKILWRISLK